MTPAADITADDISDVKRTLVNGRSSFIFEAFPRLTEVLNGEVRKRPGSTSRTFAGANWAS